MGFELFFPRRERVEVCGLDSFLVFRAMKTERTIECASMNYPHYRMPENCGGRGFA
jgi:hypothetical protein